MTVKRWAVPTVLLALLIMVVAVAAGCGETTTTTPAEITTTTEEGGAPTTEEPATGGTFTIAIQPQYKSFDPARAGEIDGMMVNFACYDTLVRAENGEITPWVAESWETEADNKTYIFKLRDDVTFNTGAKLTAEDVIFTFNRLKNVKGSPSFHMDPVESMEALDDTTLKIVLKDVDAGFLAHIAMPTFAITEAKVVREHGGTDAEDADATDDAQAWLDTNSAGSGPYTLTEYVNKQQAVLTANENYWGPDKPKFDKIVLKQIDDVNTQKLLLQKGEVDFAVNLTAEQAKELESDSNVTLHYASTLDFFHIVQNRSIEGPASKPEVWQAVRYALDYEGIRELCGEGTKTPYSVIPEGMLGAEPVNTAKQDIEKAKQIMTDAGLADGFTVDLEYPALTISGIDFSLIAQKIQQDLAAIGINVDLKGQEIGLFLDRMRSAKMPTAISMWGPDYPDPQSQMAFLPGGPPAKNYGGWQAGDDPELEALGVASSQELDVEKRVAILKQIQDILVERGPYVVWGQPTRYYGSTTNVSGIKTDPVFMLDLNALTK
ncbi:MAG: ABC transporter substrate-binding protein [Actinobacteria bacterium]|nr:ABC transporter substrate-binding protein [Actinomycetota bacterium]